MNRDARDNGRRKPDSQRNGVEAVETLTPADDLELSAAIRRLGRRIGAQWEERGFESPELRLTAILEEAVLNAYIHGNQRRPGSTIVVKWRFNDDFYLQVIDQGQGFDHQRLPDPTTPENLTKPSGRGIFILRHFAEQIDWRDGGRRLVVKVPKVPTG